MMMTIGLILGIQLARPGLLIMASLCIALSFVGMMMLMSVIGKSEQSVAGAGWAIIVTMCMFGGGMIPLAFMPPFMQQLSHFSPVKWGVLALEGAIWRGFTFTEMLVPCAILLGVGVAGFELGPLDQRLVGNDPDVAGDRLDLDLVQPALDLHIARDRLHLGSPRQRFQ